MILAIYDENVVIEYGDRMIDERTLYKNEAPLCFAFPVNFIEVENESVPNDFELYKYCYTEEKGFYDNLNRKEPEPTEQMYTLDEAAAILASEVNKQ